MYVAYGAARIFAFMGVHEVFCLLFRQLFCRNVSAMFANHDVAPVDQKRPIQPVQVQEPYKVERLGRSIIMKFP